MIKTFWRWFPIGESFVDTFISRDSDSCLTERETDAVNEWLNSSQVFHIMRGNEIISINKIYNFELIF